MIANHIHRKGANAFRLSASLAGSGIAAEFRLIRETMQQAVAIGGFGEDKVLQQLIVERGHRIHYLEEALIYDEKVSNARAFENQRKRWLFGQLQEPVATIAGIRREALLAERAAQDHSVVVLEVADPRIDARPARQIVLAARRAMLDGDQLGWLDATKIALSLPLTGPTAAAVTAARIAAEGGPAGWTVYSQPAMPEARGGDGQTDVRVRPLAELLRDPLPAWNCSVPAGLTVGCKENSPGLVLAVTANCSACPASSGGPAEMPAAQLAIVWALGFLGSNISGPFRYEGGSLTGCTVKVSMRLAV